MRRGKGGGGERSNKVGSNYGRLECVSVTKADRRESTIVDQAEEVEGKEGLQLCCSSDEAEWVVRIIAERAK